MATSFDVIEDMGLVIINDYKLSKAYTTQFHIFQKFNDGLLMAAIPYFQKDCRQSLDYDLELREFVNDLTQEEISILADFWAINWFTKQTNDVTQFQLKLQNSSSFKNYSEAQNLKEKTSWLDRLRERVYQRITDYQLGDLSNIPI